MKRLKEKISNIYNKFSKEDKIIFLIILGLTMIFCSAFLQMHYSSDTYVLIDLGYKEYPSKYFIIEGRLISTLVCYIAGIFNLPYETYIVGMDFLGIILLAITIYILYKKFEEIFKIQKRLDKILIIGATFVLILNQFVLEYLLFPESAIMCLSLLLSVIAATKVVSEDKYKFIKISILMFFSIYCYQTTAISFILISLLLMFIKQICDKKVTKSTIIEMIKIICILSIIVLGVLLSNFLIVRIVGNQNLENRLLGIQNFKELIMKVRATKGDIEFLWSYYRNMLPGNFNNLVVIITTFFMIVCSKMKKLFPQYCFIILIMLSASTAIVFLTNTGACVRLNLHIALFWGISLIYLYVIRKDTDKIIVKNCINIIIILSFIFNSIMLLRNSYEHIAANKIDENIGYMISGLLEEYERNTGIRVTKFSYTYGGYDVSNAMYSKGIKELGSLTEKKFCCGWCVESAMEFFCNREFEKADISNENLEKYEAWIEKMKYIDCNVFSEQQVLFIDDNFYFFN